MSEAFDADWAFARVRLGLSDEEFGTLTRRELWILGQEYLKQQEWIRDVGDRQTARIIATLANIHRDRQKQPKPFEEDDFMPKPRHSGPQSWEDQLAIFMTMGMDVPDKT